MELFWIKWLSTKLTRKLFMILKKLNSFGVIGETWPNPTYYDYIWTFEQYL